MPEDVFACSPVELWEKVDPESVIDLPTAPILSMLTSPRVVLPLETVIKAMSSELFVSPLPELGEQVVLVPEAATLLYGGGFPRFGAAVASGMISR